MAKFEWRAAFELGVPDIDEEHKRMLSVIYGIEDAIVAEDQARFAALMDEIIEIARSHFEKEEALLARLDYPDLNRHIEYHTRLLSHATETKKICEQLTKQELLRKCVDEMLGFLVDDIVKGDMEFKSFLQEKGVVERRT